MDPQHRHRRGGQPVHRGSRLRAADPEAREALKLDPSAGGRPTPGHTAAAFALLFVLFHLPEVVERLVGGGNASFLLLAFFPAAWWVARIWHPAGVRGAYALEGGATAWRTVAWLFVLALAAKGATLAAGYALGIHDRGIPNPYVQGEAPYLLIAITAAVQLSGLALFTFVPSLAEDILTRGLLLRWPRVRWTGVTFVAASTAVYVLNHVWRLGAGLFEWLMLAAFGIAYGAALWRRGTLWAAVGLHWGWNFAGPFLNGVTALEAVDADRARVLSAVAHLVLAAVVVLWPSPRHSRECGNPGGVASPPSPGFPPSRE